MLEWLPNHIKIGDYRLTQGGKSDYYIDIKEAMMYPGILNDIIQQMSQVMGYHQYDKVAGIEFGSVPIASGFSLWTGLPCIIVRKNERNHGIMDRIIGNLEKGDKVLLIDDVLSSGKSLKMAEDLLIDKGAVITEKAVVFDREEQDIFDYVPSLAKFEDIKFVIQHMKNEGIKELEQNTVDEVYDG